MAHKKVLILSRRDDRSDFDTAESMATSLRSANTSIKYEACFLEEVVFVYDGSRLEIINGRDGSKLSDYSALFMIGWFKLRRHEDAAHSIALYADHEHIPFANKEALINRSRSKLSQQIVAIYSGIATAPFVACVDKALMEKYSVELLTEYPIVIKSTSASRGNDNYIVNSVSDVGPVLAAARTKLFIAQSFVPNDGDYRIIVMGGKVRLVIERKAQGDSHLNNTSQGGSAQIVETSSLSAGMIRDAEVIAEAIHRDITGVDMIIDNRTGDHFFLEVNNMPQLSTGSYVDKKAAVLNAYFEDLIA
jgi:glutathione synthase/RimK-type ligase-like ATP-grasp enzyme